MTKRVVGVALVLALCGCSVMAKRLEQQDQKVERLEEERRIAVQSGDQIAIERIDAEIEDAKEERARRREDARRESESNSALWLSIIAIVTGGLKLAEGVARKAVVA